MSPPAGDPRLDALGEDLEQQIPALAALYDRWANALNPHDPGVDDAEKAFHQTVSHLFDSVVLHGPNIARSVTIRDLRRHVIIRCKKHLAATSKPSST